MKDNLVQLFTVAGLEQSLASQVGSEDEYQNGSGKERTVYYHLVYLTYIQSASLGILSWMNHKLESRLLGKIQTTSDANDSILMAESEEELKSLFTRVKERSKKSGLKLNI